jgi:hypothetical protein
VAITTASRRTLAFALATGVDIGCIEEIDAQIESLAQKGLALGLIQCPSLPSGQQSARGRASVGHAAKTNARDFQSCSAQIHVFHGFSCFEFTAVLLQL